MILQINIIRAALRFLSERTTPIPIQPQPITILEQLIYDSELVTRVWRDMRRERHGPMPEYRYIIPGRGQPPIGVYRKMEYIGSDPSRLYVPDGHHLKYEATLVTADGKRYEIAGSFRLNEPWSLERQQRKFASDLKRENRSIQEPSKTVQNAVVAADWYLTSYEHIQVSDVF